MSDRNPTRLGLGRFRRARSRPASRARTVLQAAALTVALFLPFLSLSVLGTYWLWQNGYLIIWGAVALTVTFLVYGIERWFLRDAFDAAVKATPEPLSERPETEAARDEASGLPDETWTDRERAAWADVEDLAGSVNPEELTSRDAILALGTRTVETVARSMHPGVDDPLWRFTVPEALALIEQVSGEMRRFVLHNVPFGDRITVGFALRIYSWRSALTLAGRGYDLWRVLRLMNPASAAASEVRERLQKVMLQSMREVGSRRLAEAYVREVGRAAIDLYSGRMKVTAEDMASVKSAATEADLELARSGEEAVAEPVRILLAGQAGTGRSSIANALLEETRAAADVVPGGGGYTVHELAREGVPKALLIEAPSLSVEAKQQKAFVERAASADLVIWVLSATRPDREIDRATLEAFRGATLTRPGRAPPAIVYAMTHIDRLRPAGEWAPPYDLASGTSPKAAAIRDAMAAAAADLAIETADIVPVRVVGEPYNLDALWSRIIAAMPEAERARLLRVLAETSKGGWRRSFSQAVNAGKLIGRTLLRR